MAHLALDERMRLWMPLLAALILLDDAPAREAAAFRKMNTVYASLAAEAPVDLSPPTTYPVLPIANVAARLLLVGIGSWPDHVSVEGS
jgi:hypothetical protein